jgi:hypothetical protein
MPYDTFGKEKWCAEVHIQSMLKDIERDVSCLLLAGNIILEMLNSLKVSNPLSVPSVGNKDVHTPSMLALCSFCKLYCLLYV